MLTSAQIVDLITTRKSAGMVRGRVMNSLHYEKQVRPINGFASSHVEFLTDLLANEAPAREKYEHPRAAARPGHRKAGPLEPVEIAWLQTLPRDPSQVTFEDATALAALASAVSRMQHPADARLVAAYWAPVEAMHDRAQAEITLRNAQQPVPSIPSSALGALTDAVAREVPELNDIEVTTRAGNVLRDALTVREEQRQAQIDEAQQAATG